jgi:AraC-like DNA-binding protein
MERKYKRLFSIRETSAKRGNLYKKNLVTVLVITCIPAALIGICFYFFGTAQIEREVTRTHRGQLENARQRMDDQLAHIELTAAQWAQNPLFNEKLKDIDFNLQFQTTRELYNSLFIIKGSSTLIDQVYLYIDGQRLLITEDNGVRKITEKDNEQYFSSMPKNGFMSWTQFPGPKKMSTPSLIHRLSGGTELSYGAIIVTLNEAKFNAMVRELAVDNKGYSFIIQEHGDWITTGVDNPKAAGSGQLFLREAVLKRNEETDAFVVKWDKENYSVSSGKFSRAGSTWIYVTASPLNQLIFPVLVMSRMILFVSALGIAVAVCLSWLGSKRLYKPIHHLVKLFREADKGKFGGTDDEVIYIENQWRQLIHQSHYLQDRIEEQMPTLREGFLLQLVQGHLYSFTEKELRERMMRFGWNIDEQCYSIVVVQLVGFFKSPGKFLERDRQLVTFASSNIIKELAENKMARSVAINFQDLTIGLLVNFPVEKHWYQLKSELFKLADEITGTLNNLLNLNVAICVGRSTDRVRDIPALLQEVRQTMHFRMLEESNQVFDMEEIVPSSVNPTYYPFAIEKMVHPALRRANGSDINHLINQFFEDLSSHGANEFILLQSALCLLANMQQTMLQMGFNIHHLYKGENLFEQLLKKREQQEICSWFQEKVIAPFLTEYLENQDTQLKHIVTRAVNLIETGYMHDISLEICAEQLGVHPVRLSKGFKQIVGHTFIDYLTAVRIRQSKDLLSTTDWKINDIAARVGYQPSYFNKIFRRHEGMTASEFRGLFKG